MAFLIIYAAMSIFMAVVLGCLWFETKPDEDFKLWWMPNHEMNRWCKENEIGTVAHCILDIIMNLVFGPATLLAIIGIGMILVPIFAGTIVLKMFKKKR